MRAYLVFSRVLFSAKSGVGMSIRRYEQCRVPCSGGMSPDHVQDPRNQLSGRSAWYWTETGRDWRMLESGRRKR